MRALRTATPEPTGWLADFTALFATRHAIRTSLFAAAAFALMASWEAWNLWQVLPWAQLLAPAPGGLL